MAKLNYQQTARRSQMSKQPIVNSKTVKVSNYAPTLKRKVMRFGKYKNYEFRDLPMDYLKWAILNLKDTTVLDELIRELQHRDSSFRI